MRGFEDRSTGSIQSEGQEGGRKGEEENTGPHRPARFHHVYQHTLNATLRGKGEREGRGWNTGRITSHIWCKVLNYGSKRLKTFQLG